MSTWLQELELIGEHVKLVPLSSEHRNALVEASSDGELSTLWFTQVPSEQTIDTYLEVAFKDKSNGTALPFVVLDKDTNQLLGCTRFCNAVTKNKRVEIGYTWYRKSVQRTIVNTECKYLLLSHAFENLKAIAVEFRTHWHNHASRNAIARLGAKQDGVLRNFSVEPDGAYRDTVVFSIINNEWPSVKKSLAFKLNQTE
ncbi:GNAT family N-acetyltransferase [Thalassotalea atypica]|uniref:GNAT family N-acetyltransferase n=1 Tax=Thalassotalea atypica TaxID=2054316 RepID=UPI0025723B98|nr:GNAT family protein [Thalassotalea atypica]